MADRYTVPAVDRAMHILEALADEGSCRTLAEISRTLQLPKSSVFAILETLTKGGFVQKDLSTGEFRIGVKLFEISFTYLRDLDLVREFSAIARQIVAECGETVQLAILDGTDIVYIGKEDSPRPVRLVSYIGKRLPANAPALGKALLSGLSPEEIDALYQDRPLPKLTPNTIASVENLKREVDTVRQRGHALDVEETALGLKCVAAPIRDHHGNVIAAMSISAPTARTDLEVIERLIQLVMEGAELLSIKMGYCRPLLVDEKQGESQ